ncbi:MAG: flagellar hook protein FlgE [Gammaproteobacteria bacterium]|nr:flagellar hook protein FlgE [Gammaproteobacteria bacterium]
MPFDIALTGLNAAQNDLEVISNNIANSETTGFKKSRAEFADVYASSEFGVSSNAIGQGVQLAGIQQQFTDGDLTFTDNALDLAINGQGFFVLEDAGERFYGRAGSFGVDSSGNLVDPIGNQLIGFQPDSNGLITGGLGPIVVSRADVAPQITSEIDLGANLDATATVLPAFTVGASGPDPATYNHSTSLTTYDSLGGQHLTSLYFRRDTATNWEAFAFVDGVQVDGPDILNFDPSGSLVGVNGGAGTTTTSAAFTPGGIGTSTTYTIDYAAITQFGSPFGVSSLNQNGFETGRLTSLDFASDGTLFGRYSNGVSSAFGQVALANFSNTQGLVPSGNSLWNESFASGAALVGAPGSTDLGLVQSGALEESNVDVTSELIDMIQAQRFFQSNAQVIGAADEITQTIINII